MRLPGRIIGIALLVAVLGTWQTISAQPLLIPEQSGSPAGSPGSLTTPVPHDFNLQACEDACRSRFGVNPWSDDTDLSPHRRGGGGSGSNYDLYAICIQKCNTNFWKDHDRRMEDLEKE